MNKFFRQKSSIIQKAQKIKKLSLRRSITRLFTASPLKYAKEKGSDANNAGLGGRLRTKASKKYREVADIYGKKKTLIRLLSNSSAP